MLMLLRWLYAFIDTGLPCVTLCMSRDGHGYEASRVRNGEYFEARHFRTGKRDDGKDALSLYIAR